MELNLFLQQFNLSQTEIDVVVNQSKELILHQGEEFGKVGQHADTIYYIVEGTVRSYRIIEGDEFTYAFFSAGELCADYASILTKKESQQFFQALTPAKLFAFSYENIEKQFEDHPRFERIARKLSESAYLRSAERANEFQTDSLEQRYLHLLDQHEELFQSASLQHIASYLGVKPQSLSRIRAKILKK